MVSKPLFWEPSLFSSSGKVKTSDISPGHMCTGVPTRTFVSWLVGRVTYCAWSCVLINISVTVYQTHLNMKPLAVLKLVAFSCISAAALWGSLCNFMFWLTVGCHCWLSRLIQTCVFGFFAPGPDSLLAVSTIDFVSFTQNPICACWTFKTDQSKLCEHNSLALLYPYMSRRLVWA